MKKLAVLAMVGLMSVTATAASSDGWALVATTENNQSRSYVNTHTLTNSGSYKMSFEKVEFAEYQTDGENYYNSIEMFTTVDCNSTPKRISRDNYKVFKDGKYLFMFFEDEETFNDAPIGTVGGNVADYMCSH
ncbi:surface-adhesin E family protein [Psychrobacter sp. FDAARGOS_221]|uniref:surface-adhesin E family protein n=1 Tax=Psychrobacter sp. FDAARGOS_221 TaxID=1975705 RepID=UPI000BB54E29|nr:hypothetical protein [Psychrobacter sp. FDAARGOS_221]PNK59658.1 hypothetical protein A6J60_001350 [Psychrobacter sp. FDAARGOS_221]